MHYLESSDCFEHSKIPYLNQATPKKYLPKFSLGYSPQRGAHDFDWLRSVSLFWISPNWSWWLLIAPWLDRREKLGFSQYKFFYQKLLLYVMLFFRERQDRAMPKYPGRFNPGNFGKYGHCFCICEKPGQFPCPSRVPHPDAKKPKFWQQKEAAGQSV